MEFDPDRPRGLLSRADREYLLNVYSFQESLTMLEAAVGQDLATPEN